MNIGVQGLRVLVVEDEYLIAQEENDLLTDAGCVVVGPVPTGELALHLLGRERFDVALLDINLTGKDVFGFADLLAQRHIPFAFVTGHSPRLVPRHLASYPLIRKPFSRESLLGAVQAAMVRVVDGYHVS